MVSLEDEPNALSPARLPADLSADVAPAPISSAEATASVAPSEPAAPDEPVEQRPADQQGPVEPQGTEDQRPTFVFFGTVAAISLTADITTKAWAEVVMNARGFEPLPILGNDLSITLAYNRGGAWGLLSTANEMVRLPFFLLVSAAAILFIISLYARLHARQKALKWGLPLVLGGALGNLSDRITRSQVVDFIDYQADWVMQANGFIHKFVSGWTITDHWPTFNVADIAICIGVGLMAVDMFTHRPKRVTPPAGGQTPGASSQSPDASVGGVPNEASAP